MFIFHADNNQFYFLEFSDHGVEEEVIRKISNPFANYMSEFNVVGSREGLLCICDTLFSNALYVYSLVVGLKQNQKKTILAPWHNTYTHSNLASGGK